MYVRGKSKQYDLLSNSRKGKDFPHSGITTNDETNDVSPLNERLQTDEDLLNTSFSDEPSAEVAEENFKTPETPRSRSREETSTMGTLQTPLWLRHTRKSLLSQEETQHDIKTQIKSEIDTFFRDVSDIKKDELTDVIHRIFVEEYHPKNIARLCEARESRKSFDFSSPQLSMCTCCPIRIFGALHTFVLA